MRMLLTVAMLLPLCFGFRTGARAHWAVTPVQPTVWIDVDPLLIEGVFERISFEDGTDPLAEFSEQEKVSEALRSIANDFNAVPSSYLHLQFVPGQLVGGESTSAEDMTYDATYAETHTLRLVAADPSALGAAGDAHIIKDGRDITECTIRLGPGILESARSFIKIVTHEMMHCMDMQHLHEDSGSIMSYSASSKIYRLTAEEKMMLTYSYPSNPDYAKEEATLGLACEPKK